MNNEIDKCYLKGRQYVYDLDDKKCYDMDVKNIPVHLFTGYKGKLITGKGKTIYNYLLSQGETHNTIKSGNIANTYLLDLYVKYIDEQKAENNKTVNRKQYYPSFSGVIELDGITIDSTKFPKGLIYIPNFITTDTIQKLYKSIKQSLGAQIFKEYQKNDTEPLSNILNCIDNQLVDSQLLSNTSDNKYVHYLNAKSPRNSHNDKEIYDDGICILSLGTNYILTFDNKYNVPIINGSLIILKGDSRYLSRSISLNSSINKGDLITLGFRTQRSQRDDI